MGQVDAGDAPVRGRAGPDAAEAEARRRRLQLGDQRLGRQQRQGIAGDEGVGRKGPGRARGAEQAQRRLHLCPGAPVVGDPRLEEGHAGRGDGGEGRDLGPLVQVHEDRDVGVVECADQAAEGGRVGVGHDENGDLGGAETDAGRRPS